MHFRPLRQNVKFNTFFTSLHILAYLVSKEQKPIQISNIWDTVCYLFLMKFCIFTYRSNVMRNSRFNNLSPCLGFNKNVFCEIVTNMLNSPVTSLFFSKIKRPTLNVLVFVLLYIHNNEKPCTKHSTRPYS